tara:strand:- start:94 stop:366 length:273 start_codon:yes stop_codon:yes gene_type:complete
MSGSTDIGENLFFNLTDENNSLVGSIDNVERISLIIIGVLGGIASLIYSLKKVKFFRCSVCGKMFCCECKQTTNDNNIEDPLPKYPETQT